MIEENCENVHCAKMVRQNPQGYWALYMQRLRSWCLRHGADARPRFDAGRAPVREKWDFRLQKRNKTCNNRNSGIRAHHSPKETIRAAAPVSWAATAPNGISILQEGKQNKNGKTASRGALARAGDNRMVSRFAPDARNGLDSAANLRVCAGDAQRYGHKLRCSL